MKKITSLNDLLVEELADLLNAENQLVEALPKMARASLSLALKVALEDHLEVTKEQVWRLQDIFSNIAQNPQGGEGKAMKKFIEEGEHAINTKEKGQDRDTAMINVAQQVEQYEIDQYKTAREHAVDLGHTRIVELLDKSLNEERAMNLNLSELAQGAINAQAIDPQGASRPTSQEQETEADSEGAGFYIPEGKFGRKSTKKKSKGTDVPRYDDGENANSQDTHEPRDLT